MEAALGPLPERPRLSLDAGYDYRPVHNHLADRNIDGRIAERGAKRPRFRSRRYSPEHRARRLIAQLEELGLSVTTNPAE